MRLLWILFLLFLHHPADAVENCDLQTPPSSLTKQSQSFCEVAMETAQCQAEADRNPEIRANLRDCSREKGLQKLSDTVLGCAHGAGDVVWDLMTSPYAFYEYLAKDFRARDRAIETCLQSMDCRRSVFRNSQIRKGASHKEIATVTRDQFKELWVRAEMWSLGRRRELGLKAVEIQRNLLTQGLEPNTPAWDEAIRRADPEVARFRDGLLRKNAGEDNTFIETVRAALLTMNAKLQCLNQKAATELVCYAVFSIVDPTMAAGYLRKAPHAMRLMSTASREAQDLRAASAVASSAAPSLTPTPTSMPALSGPSPTTSRGTPRSRSNARLESSGTEARRAFSHENLQKNPTTTAQNNEWIAAASEAKPDGNTLFMDVEINQLRELNKGPLGKEFATSVTNRHKEILFGKIQELEKANPGLEILRYSDFKSSRFAFRGKIPKDLREKLDVILRETNAELADELRRRQIVRTTDDPASWFSGGCGETAGRAGDAGRRGRSMGPGLHCSSDANVAAAARENLTTTETLRSSLEASYGKSPLFETKDGVSLPSLKAFSLVRENKDPQILAAAVRAETGLTGFSTADARQLINYVENVDGFSPGLWIPKRTQVSFADAVHGGLSSDIVGLGARNQHATAAALVPGGNPDAVLERTRAAERIVTSEMEKNRETYRKILGEADCSGDDCGGRAVSAPWTADEKQKILERLSGTPETARMRHSFFGPLPAEHRATVAAQGEAIEHRLRIRLRGIIPAERLSQISFGVDMKTSLPNQGSVGVFSAANGSPVKPEEAAQIQRALVDALEDYNRSAQQTQGITSKYRAAPNY